MASLADLGFLGGLPSVTAEETRPTIVQLAPDVEPLVRLIEETDRSKVLEAVADRVRSGASYQQLLTAVQLAGVRGIKPRPVGFKFHAVLVINSAHLAAQAAADRDRWLPLFWAIDNFKESQATNKKESAGWMMAPVEEGKLSPPTQAKKRFVEAMDDWDVDGADPAVASLVRTAGAGEVIELFWRYGARDFRDIGHKAIYVANAWRTLQAIGWRHAEPVMRSLAFALLEHEGTNPAKRDAEPDRPWRENLKRVGKIRDGWQRGTLTPSAAAELLATIRSGSSSDAAEQVVELLNKEVDPSNVWDGLFLAAGELLMRQPGIGGLHCVTATNALYFGAHASGNDETRRMLMLQAASFLPMFRQFMSGRGKLNDLKLDKLEAVELKSKGSEAVEEVFADVRKDSLTAARKALALLDSQPGSAEALSAEARALIFTKGVNSHDYKFSSAALEDYYHATPAWRNRFLATAMFNLRGLDHPDNDLITRVKAALAKG